jgi:asparagine N-glycosylation enzyme membrane subunit Stt3
MISGIRYKERINTKTLTGEERAAYLKSSYFILTMTGAVVLFGGLGVIALLKYLQVEFFTLLWCLIIVLVSIFLMLAARIIKATQKNEASLS